MVLHGGVRAVTVGVAPRQADLMKGTGFVGDLVAEDSTFAILQRWHGLSDREAVAAFQFDMRWKYACGGLDVDYPGFAHTVLVYTRARLAKRSGEGKDAWR